MRHVVPIMSLTNFYNLKADLPDLPKPPLHPATKEPLHPTDLEPIFPKAFIQQEISTERYLPIPEPVLEAYSAFRPTPLIYASELTKFLGTPARIFYKYEGVGPTGSHKSNTAIPQAYLAAQEGIEDPYNGNRSGPMGFCAGTGRIPFWSQGQGFHGQDKLPAKTGQADPHGDVRRRGPGKPQHTDLCRKKIL